MAAARASAQRFIFIKADVEPGLAVDRQRHLDGASVLRASQTTLSEDESRASVIIRTEAASYGTTEALPTDNDSTFRRPTRRAGGRRLRGASTYVTWTLSISTPSSNKDTVADPRMPTGATQETALTGSTDAATVRVPTRHA